ncbi:hypothetical protein EZI54_22650 [Marinobacter halodurans]|uniref:DUF6896 domain-containing protein n=1 Tax=Marinobacter halodurans TaxID=2528979 RepID=A0ABY1ZE22_9GAMM|nr:hypothetical protein [Marinobacter halodurans]TBW47489.1 hypothetical protein EZI54_22650 [Marinobacter halodurans]
MNTHNINSKNVEPLVRLIKLYVDTIFLFSSKLSHFYKLDQLTDWRSQGIPIQGAFDDGWSYAFHGTGCSITSPDVEVDFEFDVNCEVGGFDVWRLWSFVCDNEEMRIKFSEFSDKKHLQKVFDVAVENHFLKKHGGLYRLAE